VEPAVLFVDPRARRYRAPVNHDRSNPVSYVTEGSAAKSRARQRGQGRWRCTPISPGAVLRC
jgi:hypothetical protein